MFFIRIFIFFCETLLQPPRCGRFISEFGLLKPRQHTLQPHENSSKGDLAAVSFKPPRRERDGGLDFLRVHGHHLRPLQHLARVRAARRDVSRRALLFRSLPARVAAVLCDE